MQNLPVIFAIDRAGVVGADGETHHGIFDISYLSSMPNLTILAPKDAKELAEMLEYAVSLGTPCAIRYPRGDVEDFSKELKDYTIDGSAEIIKEGVDATIIPVGKMIANVMVALPLIKSKGYNVEVINPRFIKPIDLDTILKSAEKTKLIITIEDNTTVSGFGSLLTSEILGRNIENVSIKTMGWPNKFIQHGSVSELEKLYFLDPESIAKRVCEYIERKT